MVQAIIDIDDRANRVLNMVKAKYSLKDKSKAIEVMAYQYEEDILEPALRPEYIAKAQRIHGELPIKVGSVANLRKRYGE